MRVFKRRMRARFCARSPGTLGTERPTALTYVNFGVLGPAERENETIASGCP
jgi:hypothetical protein